MADHPAHISTNLSDTADQLDNHSVAQTGATEAGPSSPPSAPVTPPFDKDPEQNPPPLLDERAYEENKVRQARLVMGPPLGGEDHPVGGPNDTVIEGEQLETNELLLADYDDDALDLELTHQRIKTLRGLNLQRFRHVEVSRPVLEGKRAPSWLGADVSDHALGRPPRTAPLRSASHSAKTSSPQSATTPALLSSSQTRVTLSPTPP